MPKFSRVHHIRIPRIGIPHRIGILPFSKGLVFQGADVYFPYDNQKPLNCGNRIALDGVFEITGQTPTTVCITVDAPINRKAMAREGIRALPDSTVCTTVHPVR